MAASQAGTILNLRNYATNWFPLSTSSIFPLRYIVPALFIISILFCVSQLRLASRILLPKEAPGDNKVSISNPSTREEYETIVNSLLHDISFQAPKQDSDLEALQSQVESRLKANGVSPAVISQIQPYIKTGVRITTYGYPYVSPEVQEAIATYASYVISIDDLAKELCSDLQMYTSRLALGQPQGHSLLTGFTAHLGDQCRLFGSFGGDMIVKGTLEFLSSIPIEENQSQRITLVKEASDYLVFFRAKTGVAEPFAFFCFPEDTYPEATKLEIYLAAVPNIMLFLGYVNDILSFYKEEIKPGDFPGFVCSHAKLHNLSSLQSLHHIKDEAVAVVQKIRATCAADKGLARHIEQFMQGYVMYHIACKRYRLEELNIPAAIKARNQV